MDPLSALGIVAGLVALATVLGLVWRARQGHISHPHGETVVKLSELGVRKLAPGATLLQFSTEVCAPCAVTRTVLGEVAATRADVAHVDLDVTHRPDLARQFHILSTPTTLIVDRGGVIRARIGGAPQRDAVHAELDRILDATLARA